MSKDFEKEFAELKESQVALSSQLDTLSKENAALKTQLATLASKGAPEAAQNEAPKVPEDTFKVGKETFKFTLARFIIPKLGERTALEVLADNKKYEELKGDDIKTWLVKNQCGVIARVEK